MRTHIALLSLLALVAACSAEASSTADPIAAGVAKAAETGQNVLVLYTKKGCNCSAMMDETLADPEVQEALGKMVFVRVTRDEDAEAFESRFADVEAPSFVVLGADGEALGDVLKGPFEAGEFLFFLDWVVAPDGPQPELVRIEDGCQGCGAEDGETKTDADAKADAGGCCGEEADTDAATETTDEGEGGCCGEESGEADATDAAGEESESESGCDGCSEEKSPQ